MSPGLLVALAAVIAFGGWSASRQVRSARRNAAGQCAHCGAALGDPADAFYVEGLLVCSRCAARTRRAVRASFALIALLTLVGAAAFMFGIGSDLRRGAHYTLSEWMYLLGMATLAVGGVPVLFWLIVRGMKAENRAARARRAADEVA